MPSAGVVENAAGAAAATGGARKPARATASRPPTSITVSRFWVPRGGAQAGDVESGERDHDARAAQRAPDAGPSESTVDM